MTRVCPNPIPWNDVYKRLSKIAETRAMPVKPPIPLILNGWVYSNDAEKIARWNQTIEWAKDARCEDILASLKDEDFYFTDEVTTYQVGPFGGPMYRDWDFESKERPPQEDLEGALQILKNRWSAIANGFSDATQPLDFTGEKARRLLVAVTKNSQPPWGGWDRLSDVEEERRTFTVFRSAVNGAIKPLEVDHIDFTIETPNRVGTGIEPPQTRQDRRPDKNP